MISEEGIMGEEGQSTTELQHPREEEDTASKGEAVRKQKGHGGLVRGGGRWLNSSACRGIGGGYMQTMKVAGSH